MRCVKAEKRAFNIRRAVKRECKAPRKTAAANPRSLGVRVQYGYGAAGSRSVRRSCWQFTERDRRTCFAARPDEAPYDDIDEQFNWIYNHKAGSLRSLVGADEALVVMEAARLQPEGGSINVSQAINLGWHYVDLRQAGECAQAHSTVSTGLIH